MATKAPPTAEWRWPLPTERVPGSPPQRFGYFETAPASARPDADLSQRGLGNAATAGPAAGPSPAAGFANAQRGIGNAAMVARQTAPPSRSGGGGGGGGKAAGPGPAPEAADQGGGAAPAKSGLAALKAQVGSIAKRQKKPADSRSLVARTRKSAIVPEPELKRKAATAKLEDLAKTGEESPDAFDTAAFKEALRKKVQDAMPDGKTGEDVRKALSSETGVEVANEMKGELASSQTKAVGNLPEAARKAPDSGQFSVGDPPPLTAPPPGERPAPPSPAGAVPQKLPDAALDTRADRNDADAQLASQDLSQDQLKRSNEPSFVDTAETRDTAEQHSAAGPPEVRKAEDSARGAARARGSSLLNAGISALFGGRAASFLGVFGQQDAAKAQEEAKRAEIAKRLDDIQGETRRDVELTLSRMETLALLKFNTGLQAALAAFDEKREQTEAAIRKTNRSDALSSGNIIGALIADYGDLDESEVNFAIKSARRAFTAAIDRAIDDVANTVGPVLLWAKKRIEQGRKAAADYVAGLDKSVATIAGDELERINGEFDTLSTQVDSRRDGLINKLGESYAAASKAVEARAEAFRNANKSWWQKLKDKVRGVIRAIIQIKDMFASILSKLAGVVGAILKDPGGFLGNFVSAVKTGLNNFTDNFLSHLKAGFFEWLFGQAAEAGISVPKKFDAAGIFGLIASVIGLTVENVRQRAVAKVGATAVAALEAGAGILLTLKEKGLEGLWELLSDKLESLKESVVEQIQSMLEIEVIKAGIMWLIGLLNPVSAFIKACKAIYEIVMFFVNNGKRIMDFVNTVIDGIGDIAKGSLGAASAKIEQSLARLIPLIIGFLAALLGLGGIAGKVKAVIARIQAPVNRAIDAVIDKAVALVKAGAAAVKGLFAKKEKKDELPVTKDPEHDAKVAVGLAAIGKEEAKHSTGGKISEETAQGIAAKVHSEHKIFKSITVHAADNHWIYDYVASEGKYTGALTDEGAQDFIIDSFGDRPGFREDTRVELPVGAGEHRRHIVAWEVLHLRLLQGTVGNKVHHVCKMLSRLRYQPDAITIVGATAAGRKYLLDKHNDPSNLWVGPGSENSSLGARAMHARKAAQEAIQAKDRAKFDEAIATLRVTWHDPDPTEKKKGFRTSLEYVIRSLQKEFETNSAEK